MAISDIQADFVICCRVTAQPLAKSNNINRNVVYCCKQRYFISFELSVSQRPEWQLNVLDLKYPKCRQLF